ncbi:MAG: acylneuraminate cytidylyltransferase family protein [Desulfuromusa sp.]|nr:acylneuraminate cytidylyltransferase family protein [Desulfuromusa sp.]
MFDGKKILALIPARGGSKGLPGKNTRELCGKPLITWSIDAAKASSYVDRTIVSTDCPMIASIAKSAGADVPFMRPAELATDSASNMDTCLHAMEWLEKNVNCYNLLLVLQPTSPLRTTADIDAAIEKLGETKASSVVSVCETDHHPWWSNQLPQDGNMKDFLRPEILNKNRQDLPKFYRLNGAIYLAQVTELKKNRSFYGPKTFAYLMPTERSVDIDLIQDFLLAEAYLTL